MVTKESLATACRALGSQVAPLPAGIDGGQLLWAISGVESSYGKNVVPRHEPAYDVGGIYSTHAPMPELLEKWGSHAACSYGPWQILLVNAPTSAPQDFDDLQTAGTLSVKFLNTLLERFKPSTLNEIASCWNAGHIQSPMSPGVVRYAADLANCYQDTMPGGSDVEVVQ